MTSEERSPAGSATTRPASAPGGTIGRLLAILAGAVLLALGLMFSLVALAAVLIVGSLVYAYLHWKTRHLRRHLEQQMRDPMNRSDGARQGGGRVIDGEVIADEDGARGSPGPAGRLPAVAAPQPSRDRSAPAAGDC